MGVTIEIRFADGRTETRELSGPLATIGREQGDLVLGDPKVSGRHGELRIEGGAVSYRDVGSSNGSFTAEGVRIESELPLREGQSLMLGSSLITVRRIETAAAPAPAAKRFAGGTIVMNPGLLAAAQAPPAASPPSAPQPSVPAAIAPTPLPAAPTPPPAAPTPLPAQPVSAQPVSAPPVSARAQAWTPMSMSPSARPEPQPAAEASNVWADDLGAGSSGAGAGTGVGAGFDDAWAAGPGGSSGAGERDAEGFLAAPLGVPPGVAGKGMTDFVAELKLRLSFARSLYEPHARPLAKFVLLWLGPFALLEVAFGFVPLLGLLMLPMGLVQGAIAGFFVTGVVAQYALQIHRGESPDVGRATRSHMAILVPWSLTMIVVGIASFIGFFWRRPRRLATVP